MHGEHTYQAEAIVEVTLEPPSTVVHKLGEMLLEHQQFDAETHLPEREQEVFALLAETEPPFSRSEVARRLGYATLEELSHIENGIFLRLRRYLPDAVRQELAEEREREHVHLVRHAVLTSPKEESEKQQEQEEQKQKAQEEETTGKPPPATSPKRAKQSEKVGRTPSSPPKPPVRKGKKSAARIERERVISERGMRLTAQRVALREIKKLLLSRDEDVSDYLGPTQYKVYLALSNELGTNPEVQADLGHTPKVLLGKAERIISRLMEKAADSLAFPVPPEPKRVKPPPVRTPRKKVEKSPAQLERARIKSEKHLQLTELRIALQGIDRILTCQGKEASQYLSPTKFKSYDALCNELKTNREVQIKLNARLGDLLPRSQLLIDKLLEEAADSLAFPMPPESESERLERLEADIQALQEQRAAEKDTQIIEVRETLRAMDKLLSQRGVDVNDHLIATQIIMYAALCGEAATNQQVQANLDVMPATLLGKGRRIIDRLVEKVPESLAFPTPELQTESGGRGGESAEDDREITRLRIAIRDINGVLAAQGKDVGDYLRPTQLRAYTLCNEPGTNQQVQEGLNCTPQVLIGKAKRVITRLMNDLADVLSFPIPPPVSAPPIAPDRLHYTHYIRTVARRNINQLTEHIADVLDVGAETVSNTIQGKVHPPLDEVMRPLMDRLKLNPEVRKSIELRYMRERLPKVMHTLQITPSTSKVRAAEDNPGPGGKLPPTTLQQLDVMLRQNNFDIRKAVPSKLVDVYDVIYGNGQPRHIVSQTYGISVQNVDQLESRIIARIAENLPSALAKQQDIRALVKPYTMAREGSWRPARPASLPSNHSNDAWAAENELRRAIIEMSSRLQAAGQDPSAILRNFNVGQGSFTHLVSTHALLLDPSKSMVDVFYTSPIKRRNELTRLIKHVFKFLADVLSESSSDAQAVEVTAHLPQVPGEFLREVRQQLKAARGYDVSDHQLSRISGMSGSAIQRFFRGISHPPVERALIPLAKHLGVDKARLAELIAQEKKLQYEQSERMQAGRTRPKSEWKKTGRK